METTDTALELDLFRKIQQGDQNSFKSVFDQHYQGLCNYARKFLDDMDTAEEIVQDLFVRFWEKRADMELSTSLSSYLYRSVHNGCLNYIKSQNVRSQHRANVEASSQDGHQDFEDTYATHELSERIANVIESLPEQCRKIFKLKRQENLKNREIAEKLGISIKTVEAQMGKALKILREKLKDYAIAILLLAWILDYLFK